jgi:hypothetical protein
MSALTILLLGMLAMTAVWLGWGFLAADRRQVARRLNGGPDRTATLLFDRWAGQ